MQTFSEVLEAVSALERANPASAPGRWSPARTVGHCAQSIEYSLSAYPQPRSALFRATLGRVAKWKFLRQGRMSHGLLADIPGAPVLDSGTTLAEACTRLRAAIDAFRSHSGPLAPHLAYGPCTREEYERLHAMHVADHLAAFAA